MEQATDAKNQLASLLRNNVKTNANEIKNLANSLVTNKKYIPSFLFFQIASAFFERELPPKDSINEIRLCCWEIKEICKCIGEGDFYSDDSTSLVSQLVLGMLELKDRIAALKKVHPQLQSICHSHCCYYIALCLGWDEQYDQSERYWNEAIRVSDNTFAEKASLYKYYGDLKSNLAYVYECQSRFDEAVQMYNQALNATGQATDFATGSEKITSINCINVYIEEVKKIQADT